MIGKPRELYFDFVKAFLMFFVICGGHLETAGIIEATPPLPSWYFGLVTGASMPCFFAISGMFAAKTFEAQDWAKIMARLSSLSWPILSFGILFGLYSAIRLKECSAVVMMPIELWHSLWFLRTLVIVYFVSALVFALSRNRSVRLALFAALYAGLVFLPSRTPHYGWLKDVMHMLPYFVFGIFVLRRLLEQDAWMVAVVCGLFFLVVAFSEGSVRENGMAFYWVDSHWRQMIFTRHGLLCFFGRTAMGISGTVALLWLFRWLLSKLPGLAKLAPLGTTTLGVYTMHQWLLARVGNALGGGGNAAIKHLAMGGCWSGVFGLPLLRCVRKNYAGGYLLFLWE